MRERWKTVWPPPKEVTDKQNMLIEDEKNSCDTCRTFFGWVTHRSYKNPQVIGFVGATLGPFYVVSPNDDFTILQKLGSSPNSDEACEMAKHIRAA